MKTKVLSLILAVVMLLSVMTSMSFTVAASDNALPDPVIMSFQGLVNMTNSQTKFCDFDGETEGSYNLVKAPDGTLSVRLNYSQHQSFANYRMMPSFTKKNAVTDQHAWVRVTYMTEDPIGAQITMKNNKTTTDEVTLVQNTSVSGGKFVTSNAVYIATGDLLNRYIDGIHCTIGWHCPSDNSNLYIKEIAFFASEEQAYEYYGDEPAEGTVTYSELNYGTSWSTGTVYTGQNYGNTTVNTTKATLDITYAPSTNHGVHYMGKLMFAEPEDIRSDNKFVRVLYSAKNPAGETGITFVIRNDKNADVMTLCTDVKDTNGEYVLTDTVELTADTIQRFAGVGAYNNTMHNSFNFSTKGTDGVYSIKAVYFFPTKESADEFVPVEKACELSIAGNDISKYKIVVPASQPSVITVAANEIVSEVKRLTGVSLPIVTDETAATDYEIVMGNTTRNLHQELLKGFDDGEKAYQRYAVAVVGSKLVFASEMPFSIETAVESFAMGFLYKGIAAIPEKLEISDSCRFNGLSTILTKYENWAEVTNAADPEIYSEDFGSDDGYFTEDGNTDDFVIANGVMSASSNKDAVTYIHVYEANATVKAELTYKGSGDFGFMLRYTAPEAYVKAGYDIANGEWYIESREGADFDSFVLAREKMTLSAGKTYEVLFAVDRDNAYIMVDGTEIVSADGITQLTPGRVAVYADNAALTVDNFKLALLSGMGTIMQNVVHNLLPGEEYREGGSVIELNDGTIRYCHHHGANFVSTDGGKTWQRSEAWTTFKGYFNMIRLVDGKLLKVDSDNSGLWSYTSSDEGKTWVKGGRITDSNFRNDSALAAVAVNMNDKLNQSASGTIYYCQNYETKNDFEGKKVFCEFFFSKDNGATWTKSDTTSWTIEGNETEKYFGECKIVECADGTVRMYNSWNQYGCVVYSDSTDGGKTFGPIKTMPELPCGRSSMQFYRDPYGETDTTYYMIWVNTQNNPLEDIMPRSSISLAKSTDGKNWVFLGDIWRWQSNYRYGTGGSVLNHIVDPFVKTTEDYVIVGTGLAEHMAMAGDNSYHGAQRQHIWSIAKSTLGEGTPLEDTAKLYKFNDVTTDDSFYDAVKYAVDKGLFNGTSETTFDPDVTMNRAMFVTVLARLDGAKVDNNEKTEFTDVKVGQWYTGSVAWAAKNSIVNGMGGGIYGVDGTITIEQACTILYRYTSGKVITVSGDGMSLSDFRDSGSVSSWAKDGVEWAVENGIYKGIGGELCPGSAASRATVAVMFANLAKGM